MTTAWLYLAVFIAFVGLFAEMIRWRERAEALNRENLELTQKVDYLERALAPKPQVRFPVEPTAFPELLFAEKKSRPLPGNVRRLTPRWERS